VLPQSKRFKKVKFLKPFLLLYLNKLEIKMDQQIKLNWIKLKSWGILWINLKTWGINIRYPVIEKLPL